MFMSNVSGEVTTSVPLSNEVTVERFSNGLVYTRCADYDNLVDFVEASGFTWTDRGFVNFQNGVEAMWVDYGGLYHCSWMAITK